MANTPTETPLPQGDWVKVASGVEKGNIWILNIKTKYRFTYVQAGAAAPAYGDYSDSGPLMYTDRGVPINHDAPIDVYLVATDADGLVLVSV